MDYLYSVFKQALALISIAKMLHTYTENMQIFLAFFYKLFTYEGILHCALSSFFKSNLNVSFVN